MKFAWIDAEEANRPLVVMCGVLPARKAELGDSDESVAHPQRQLFDFIAGFHNHRRLHSALGVRSSAE